MRGARRATSGRPERDLRPHLGRRYDTVSGQTVVDDGVIGTGLNQFNYAEDASYWNHSTTTSEAYKGTNSWEGTANKYVTFTFQGSQIQLYVVRDANYGIAALSLDNGPETLLDLYSKTRRAYNLIWAASNLTTGVNHTLKVRITGTKNPKSTGTVLAIDAAIVSNTACVNEPDSSFCARRGRTAAASPPSTTVEPPAPSISAGAAPLRRPAADRARIICAATATWWTTRSPAVARTPSTTVRAGAPAPAAETEASTTAAARRARPPGST